MKQLFIVVFCLFSGLVSAQSAINIIPAPVSVREGAGFFSLKKGGLIGYEQPEAGWAAGYLADELNRSTGYGLKTTQSKTPAVVISTGASDKTLGQEGYRLEVTTKGIKIDANTPAGAFYGVQTLLQLFPAEIRSTSVVEGVNWNVPVVSIDDQPRFGWRGIMLDVSRHFFSVADVKKYIDEMARYKYNTFHWHLTDDNGWRVEIKSLPKLTEVGAWRVERHGRFGERAEPRPGEPATYGGFYSHEDIREVIRYASERNITIVPEIDVPGHCMAALAAYPELSCTKQQVSVNPGTDFSDWYGNGTFKMNVENTLNPSDEKVYEFLDKVFTEVAALFPNQYIHVGGDECYKGYWKEDPGCQALMEKQGIRHVEDLQGYFMSRVGQIIQSKGKKMIGWDEILEGGITPGAAVMSWRGVKGGIQAAKMGHEVVMTPTTYAYIDYNQGDQTIDPPIYSGLRVSKSYSFEPVPDGVEAKYILGGQANLWTEQVPSLRYAEYMTYPRAWALAEVYWSPKEAKNWNSFASRMEKHFRRSDAAGVNYSSAVYDPAVKSKRENGQLLLVLESEISGVDIHYTLDETMPDNRSPKYSSPVPVPEGPVNVRVQAYRNGTPSGHLITLKRSQLEARAQ